MSKEKLIPEFRFPEFKGEWSLEELGQCLDYLQPTPFLVDNTDYNDEYEIPVLTAGKSFILGYTNEQEGIFNENLPVIIFDDFTTASQFVDFPFKTKSSAMKILLAKNDNDIKFVYESMQTLNYEVGVHKRHWISVFSKLRIAVPKPQEQQKIASCLSSLDELIAAHKDKLDALKDHKKGLLQNLFPQEGETVPKVRFPEFEDDGEWEIKRVEDFFDVGSSKRVLQKDWTNDGVPFYRTRELVSLSKNEPFGSEIFISEDLYIELKESYGVPVEGDFLVSGVGTLGVIYQVKKEDKFYFKDGNVIWFSKREELDSSFFEFCFESSHIQNQIDAQTSKSTVGTYTIKNARITEFWHPPRIEEQQKIASCLSAVDELITAQQDKIDQLQQHKKGMMQGLFPKIES